MKKVLFLLSLLLMLTSSVKVLAQSKPKAGDTISGVVTDSVSPLMAVYITELDSADRAVAYAYTDLKGEFSFRLVNPKDRIQFSLYRKEKIVLPMDKAYFEIRMQDDKSLPPVSWVNFEPLNSRDMRDVVERSSKGLLDVSFNTTDPGIPQKIQIRGNVTAPASAQNSGNVIRGVAGVKIDTVLMSIDEAIEELERIPGYGMVFDDEASFVNTKFENGYGYVDLGLSVKWAMCNVGAERPEEYGDYFAWGELEPKESYTWENYRFRTRGYDEGTVRLSKYTSICYTGLYDENGISIADDKTLLEPEDDVARVKWGGKWRMPSREEFDELIQNCTWTWTTQKGVNGFLVTSNKPGYTDRSIFLPAAGLRSLSELRLSGNIGFYWTTTPSEHFAESACFLYITPGFKSLYESAARNQAHTVRPVCP